MIPTKEELRSLVENAIREQTPAPDQPSISRVAVFAGAPLERNGIYSWVKRETDEHTAAFYWENRPDGFHTAYDFSDRLQRQQAMQLTEQVRSYTIVSPCFAFLNRLIHLQDDECVFVRLALSSLLEGKRVELAANNGSGELRKRYVRQLHEAEKLGFQWVGLERPTQCQPHPSNLLLEEDVVRAHSAGIRVIPVHSRCVTTPLALDRAREWEIHIQKAEE